MSYPFDRQFQQRLELIFKKAEFDRMQEYRQKKAQEAQQQNTAKNDNAGACPKKNAAPAPKPR